MSLIETRRHARLMLQDGTEFRGFAFGHEASVTGEVVFQTGMTGYIEDITGACMIIMMIINIYSSFLL